MALKIFSTYHKKNYFCIVRSVVSALHIPGHLSKAAVSILTPDLSSIDNLITNDLVQLQKNLSARNSSFHLDSFIQQWNHMRELRLKREQLEIKRMEVTQMMKQVVSSTADSTLPIKIEEVKQEGIKLRTQLKDLTTIWWDVEETAVTRALSLPNSLHSETPIDDSIELYSFILPESNSFRGDSAEQDIKFVGHSPTAFYLRGLCARLELHWIKTFTRDWINKGYNLISPPDFVRSIVVDGCGLDFNNSQEVLSLATIPEHGSLEKGNGFHLVGGSSLPAMVAFLTKNTIQEPFPLRLISTGRTYHPPTISPTNNEDLTNTMQASSMHLLTVMKNCPDAMFQELVCIQETISRQLQKLNIKFRIIAVAARHLEPWEQYRSSIELYSSSSKNFIQVAYVSIIGDYISRRLSIYGPQKESPGFVTAQALSVPKLLSCYLKNQSHQ